MNCSEARVEIVAFVDGELSERDAQAVREHIATCATCSAIADGHRAASDLLAAYPRIEPRHDATRAILDAVGRQPAPVPRRVFPLRRWLAAAAGVAALVTVGAIARHWRFDLSTGNGADVDPIVREIVKDFDLYDDLDDIMSPDAAKVLDLIVADPNVDESDEREE